MNETILHHGKRGGMMETIANIINLIGGIVLIGVVIFWGTLAKRFSKLLSNIEQENIDRSELDESENVFGELQLYMKRQIKKIKEVEELRDE
ncbi:hypothetical protein [Lactococcus protaetiae]|uniref:Uncharacterized protein n=1 Tax=Lactococcus protaetiae TaxID=2592653 RepID=A0A514ZA62_9LACT|nr:hypothetical protein [Lactococcus protaetiae]QDK71476.1 hypothetical protein FLP15_10270 [Lactococcus protaetiae]